MVLACQNIAKSFGTDEIIKNASFHIEEHEKAAIVGINGAGKSTLLKIIMKEFSPDEGEVILSKNRTLGYLAQHQELNGERTIQDEVLSAREDILEAEHLLKEMEEQMKEATGEALEQLLERYNRLNHAFDLKGGYAYRSEVNGIIRGLGFSEEDFHRPMQELSGGQKTRVCLGRLLVSKPDLLLLDEPTNHLDMSSIAWLETFLSNYKGAVLIVSHDRYFLDKIVTKVIEMEHHKIMVFEGNYSEYAKKKAAVREAALKQYYNQQQEIKHQEEVIAKLKSFNREKSIKRAESREKMLGKMERLEKPMEEQADMKIRLSPSVVSGNDVLKVEGLTKAFPPNTLFTGISFEIKRQEKVALIGDNGTGKTTMLKIINGMLNADAGKVTAGANVKIGYYDQEHQVLHGGKTLFEEISDAYPVMTQTQIRNLLAEFLFTEDDVFKRVSDLSGGERGRLSLAKLMLSEANFLILDEPTNHLDMVSKEILEQALNRYTGTVLFVSHDRYFINQTATRILDLTEQTVVNYIGNYDYYLEKHDTVMCNVRKADTPGMQNAPEAAEGKNDWRRQKEIQAKKRRIENGLAKMEEQIDTLEQLLAEKEQECEKPGIATNSAKLFALHEEMTKLREELDKLYEAWEKLASEKDS